MLSARAECHLEAGPEQHAGIDDRQTTPPQQAGMWVGSSLYLVTRSLYRQRAMLNLEGMRKK